MMLVDCIRQEVEAGRLPRHWTVRDLRGNLSLAKQYGASTLNTLPCNHSLSLPELGLGHGVSARPGRFLFYRIGQGRSLVFALPEHADIPADILTGGALAIRTKKIKTREVSELDASLHSLFEFMRAADRRLWNERLQIFWNKRSLFHCESDIARLTALLHGIVNTQSKIKLDNIAVFWKRLSQYQWPSAKPSMGDLIAFLLDSASAKVVEHVTGDIAGKPWAQLFHALKHQPGWGDKTAALFVKNVIRIHRVSAIELHFLSDGAELAMKITDDFVFLPVDAVIIHIFKTCFPHVAKANFSKINAYLHDHYTSDEMLLWDDLWFWGFLTQNSKSNVTNGDDEKRVVAWNAGKYWTLEYYSWADLESIKKNAEEFMKIILKIRVG